MNKLITQYPDGTSYAEIKDANYANITHKINSYEDLWHLGQILEAANHNGVKPTVTIPCLIDAQADRRFQSTQSHGLKLVCNFLNQFDVLKYRIFHPHNMEVVEALINNVEIIDNSEFIAKVFIELSGISAGTIQTGQKLKDNLIIMSSDAGGFKPLMKLCDKIKWQGETFSASKSRSWDEKEGTKFVQQIDRQDFGGKDILIVDDLCIYGGTFKGLSKLLRQRNCGKLYLAVSHMTVQNLGNHSVTNYFDKVFTTNSKHESYISVEGDTGGIQYEAPSNLEIIKLW